MPRGAASQDPQIGKLRLARRRRLPPRQAQPSDLGRVHGHEHLEQDIEIAAISGRSINPNGSNTSAAIGSASEL
jgi:hypothetical protein